MTSPPQPHRKPLIMEDLDLGTGAAMPVPDTKRKAANQRQREAAERDAEHERWRQWMIEQNYGPQ